MCLIAARRHKLGNSMLIQCPNCNEVCETEAEIAPGQHVLCPFCNVKFSYCAVSPTGESLETRNQIVVKCPDCGTEYEVSASDIGLEIGCEVCGRKFVIGAQEKNVEEKSPPIATSKISAFVNKSKSKVDKQRRQKPDTRGCSIGCLAIVLPIIALFIIAGMHNWTSVLLAVVIGFFCIMICVYHKLNKQLDGGATLSDAFKRLGVGGSSISVVALTLACVFFFNCSSAVGAEFPKRPGISALTNIGCFSRLHFCAFTCQNQSRCLSVR